MISIRTDLAIEAKQAYTEENKRELDGVRVDEENDGDIKVTTVYYHRFSGIYKL